MELESAIKLLKNAVKNAGSIDQRHIDLTLVPAEQRKEYEKALSVAQKSVKEGLISRDALLGKLGIN